MARVEFELVVGPLAREVEDVSADATDNVVDADGGDVICEGSKGPEAQVACVCVRARVRACVRACVFVCVCKC